VSNTDWSWGPLLIDFDNDGFKDLFIANGIKRDFINYDFNLYRERRQRQFVDDKSRNLNQVMLELVRLTPTRAKINYIFKNNGDLTFSNKNTEWGMGSPSFSNGAAYADLDNDGDLDIIVNNVDKEAFIYKNNASEYSKNHFLQIQLSGVPKNLVGIGSKVTIHHGGNMQVQELYLTRGYQSAVDKRLHFGLGNDTIVDRIEVNWPDNNVQILKDIQADQIIHVEYKLSEKEVEPPEEEIKLFTDITKSLNIEYVHIENDFNDFEREVLLPYKYSNLGSGIGVGDVNNDGLDDFYIGGAKVFPGSFFLQKPGGDFILSSNQPWKEHRQSEDIGVLFFDA
ncbi:MAG: CRTAC1 family protein, partial [Cyclobacteriaceae bacterium]|nr:CRTAC1 family protein [Cyclobacteriaceae bacterium]